MSATHPHLRRRPCSPPAPRLESCLPSRTQGLSWLMAARSALPAREPRGRRSVRPSTAAASLALSVAPANGTDSERSPVSSWTRRPGRPALTPAHASRLRGRRTRLRRLRARPRARARRRIHERAGLRSRPGRGRPAPCLPWKLDRGVEHPVHAPAYAELTSPAPIIFSDLGNPTPTSRPWARFRFVASAVTVERLLLPAMLTLSRSVGTGHRSASVAARGS